MKVTLIGLGLMGEPMAAHLLEAGHEVVVVAHRSRAAIERIVAKGAREAKSIGEAAASTELALMLLPTSHEVEAVLFGKSGIAAGMAPGYLAVDEVLLKGRFKTLIDEVEGPELTEALSQKFDRDLHPYPRLTTIMGQSQAKYGAIHTDGASKVMTMLVYLNDDWEVDEGGRLRVLFDGKNYEPYALEVPPTMGQVFAFLRADNSWHGHKPFTGQRKVVQVAWIKDQAELERKKKRNNAAQFFKSIFGR